MINVPKLLFVKSVILFQTLLMTACSPDSVPGDVVTEISEVYTSITHFHPSFYSKQKKNDVNSIGFTFAFRASDPQGIEDIYSLNAVNESKDEYYSILGSGGYTLSFSYQEEKDVFMRSAYNPNSLHRMDFDKWKIYAVDERGNQSNRAFEFLLSAGDTVLNETFVYSDIYDESTDDGVRGLEVMTVEDSGLSFTSDSNTECSDITFNISFTATDIRVESYELGFFGQSEADLEAQEEIAIVSEDSVSIEATPITVGEVTNLTLPCTEIKFIDDKSVSDIEGMVIKLVDEPIEYSLVENELWHSFIGVSEYTQLASD